MDKPRPCPQCNGTGYDTSAAKFLADIVAIRAGTPNCRVCAGTGKVVPYRAAIGRHQTTGESEDD